MSPHRIVLAALYLVAGAAIAYYLLSGQAYYTTPLIDRPHHPSFWALKPGGTLGHTFGIIGSSLMVVMLLYSVRKRARFLRNAGRLSTWLDFHIFCGVVGPLFIILHSSFKVQGLVALSFWSMIAVALSGVLGRYLYLQIPRTRAGDELTLAEVESESRKLSERLRLEFGFSDESLKKLDEISAAPERKGVLRLLFELPIGNFVMGRKIRRFEQGLKVSDPRQLKALTSLIHRKAELTHRIALWQRLHAIFHYWHVFHKPFAVVMYVFMVVHIAVALMTGYGFSSSP